MDKELIDRAWRVLPAEFKEEVKNYYQHTDCGSYAEGMLESIFGEHNLTSDAEGELLTVSRKKVQEIYAELQSVQKRKDVELYNRISAEDRAAMLFDLFGSKCLPDETRENAEKREIKREEPITQFKFKIGDKVRVKGTKQIGTIKEPYSNDIGCRVYFEDGDGGWDQEYQEDELIPYKEPKPSEPKFKVRDTVMVVGIEKYDGIVFPILDRRYSNQGWIYEINIHEWINEAWLEPYTEPEEESRNLSQSSSNLDKQFDNILKDSFSKERRLNIAAMMMQGILANPKLTQWQDIDREEAHPKFISAAFCYADTLIKESEKGGKDRED